MTRNTMTQIVLVHGIGKQVEGPHTLLADLYPALSDGLALAASEIAPDKVSVAFYGDIFRRPSQRDLDFIELDASDVTDPLDHALLMAWWQEAACGELNVPGPQDAVRLRTPYPIQQALDALSHSKFFAGISEQLLILSTRQVRRYLSEPSVRADAQARVASHVTPDTKVIVAHSLGSVVAYEALCAHPEWSEIALVTLGSPLGIRNLIFDRLRPAPTAGKGYWPPPVRQWTNIADRGDVVALVKDLSPSFGPRVSNVLVHNGAKAHDVRPYLTALETGQAVAAGIARK
jgi:hypothetical protein